MTSRKPNPDFITTCLWIIAKKPSFVSIGEFTSDYTVAIAHVKKTKKKKKTETKQKNIIKYKLRRKENVQEPITT